MGAEGAFDSPRPPPPPDPPDAPPLEDGLGAERLAEEASDDEARTPPDQWDDTVEAQQQENLTALHESATDLREGDEVEAPGSLDESIFQAEVQAEEAAEAETSTQVAEASDHAQTTSAEDATDQVAAEETTDIALDVPTDDVARDQVLDHEENKTAAEAEVADRTSAKADAGLGETATANATKESESVSGHETVAADDVSAHRELHEDASSEALTAPADTSTEAEDEGRAVPDEASERVVIEAEESPIATPSEQDAQIELPETEPEPEEVVQDFPAHHDVMVGPEQIRARPNEAQIALLSREVTAVAFIDEEDHCNFAVRLDSDGPSAVYKPAKGEYEGLRTSIAGDTYWQNEVAAYATDQMLGFDLVPTTAVLDVPSGIGSVQEWVDGNRLPVEFHDPIDNQKMAVLDYVIGNTDRHSNNYITSAEGRPAAIDNGLSFPRDTSEPLRSTFFPDVVGKRLDPSVLDAVRSVDRGDFSAMLKAHGLPPGAVTGAVDRLAEIQRCGEVQGRAWNERGGKLVDGATGNDHIII